MYVCGSCLSIHPGIKYIRKMSGGDCEMHGHLQEKWGHSSGFWLTNIKRPVDLDNPKKYIWDQIDALPGGDEQIVAFGVRCSRVTAERIRDHLTAMRSTNEGTDDFKNGWYEAMSFVARQLDESLKHSDEEIERQKTT